MLPLAFIGLLLAGRVLAQEGHAIEGYRYAGCMQFSAAYGKEVALTQDNCTPEECQQTCKATGFHYAAVFYK